MKYGIKMFAQGIVLLSLVTTASAQKPPAQQEVLAAMKRATGFMVDTVSCRGGYLWYYSADLSERWGEAPARPSQIWTQAATPDVGEMFLRMYRVTGDEYYLRCAEKAADALIYGQHPLGGWHYVIDFDKPGLDQWYRDVFSQFKWGMEEYRHYYGNCTYDDNTTQGCTRFLLRLYVTTLDPAYREPLLRALDFMLISQYPNGAWPQRYPLRYEFVHDGLADYTSYYTLNDNMMRDILDVLVEAWEKLGNEEYLEAALRGADFLIASQGPEDQAGWAEQYDLNMQPAWARTHEPAGYMPRQTVECILQLERFYLMTGDRRYLAPVPRAIGWLEKSTFKTDSSGHSLLARYYEPGTNKPVYQYKTDKVNELGYGIFRYDSDPNGVEGNWIFTTVDVAGLKKGYERVSALSPEQAKARYSAEKTAEPRVPKTDPAAVRTLIESLDSRGAWIGEFSVYDMTITMSSETPVKTIKGIALSSFMQNMNMLADYIETGTRHKAEGTRGKD
ncbi:pectate lyase [bacterium]|nr:pectate lyase [bacterium]